jgi:DMSO/TMAO reductase YedYZ molybdopterin-dependent catalytic subunit
MDIVRLNIDEEAKAAPTQAEVRFQVAALAALAAIVASLIARFAFDAPLVPELMAHFFFSIVPIWMVEIAVGMLGPFAKHLAFLACVVVYGLALAGAAIGSLRLTANRRPFVRRLSIVGLVLSLWIFTLAVVMPLLGGGILGRYLRQGAAGTVLWLLIIFAVYGAAVALVSMLFIDRPQLAESTERLVGRRRLMRGIGYAVVAVGLYDMGRSLLESWLQSGSGRVSGGDGAFPNITGLAREVTPNTDFYKVSKNPFDPLVDTARWRLEIAGMVDNALSLSYDEIKALPYVEQYATLECIDNQVGGNLIGNALWRGVRLKDLLKLAGLKPGVVDIVLRASDDYSDSISLERATADGNILAYEMNGEPLSAAHGFPLRLIVPGIFGMKNVKWVTRIEAVDYDFKGYWQKRGWDDRAEYKTMSRIDAPADDVAGTTTIAGVAFAGDRGVSRVEVSTDGGRTWEPAQVKPALSPYSWALWHKQWTPQAASTYNIAVRATDGSGVTQTAERTAAAPSGASGHHTKTVVAVGE